MGGPAPHAQNAAQHAASAMKGASLHGRIVGSCFGNAITANGKAAMFPIETPRRAI